VTSQTLGNRRILTESARLLAATPSPLHVLDDLAAGGVRDDALEIPSPAADSYLLVVPYFSPYLRVATLWRDYA
jgi:hypothetical protein